MLLRWSLVTTLLLSISGCGNLLLHDSGPNRAFNPDLVADIEPRIEPLSSGGNPESYSIFGKTYHILKSSKGFVEKGEASWYGSKFHGRKTSNGERYDMYTISAAHKELPIPTYLEVTNLENGQQLIVRVNDRGPFHLERIIDLSYAAAAKLGYADKGTAQVEIRAIDVAQYQREKLRTTPSSSATRVTVTPFQSPQTPKGMRTTPLPMVDDNELAEESARTTQSPVGEVAKLTTLPVATTAKSEGGRQIYIQLGAFSIRANAEQIVKRTTQAQISPMGMATIQPVPGRLSVIYRVRLGPFSSESEATEIVKQLTKNNIGEPQIFHDS